MPDGSQQRIIMSPSFDNLYDNTTGTIRAIELGLSKLAPDGKMVVVTPSRLALDDRAKGFRERLTGKLQSVISIPAFGGGSTMPSCVWVFGGKDSEEITFVDGTDFGTHMRGGRALGLAVDGLMNAICNKASEYVLTLPSSEIDGEGFYPPRLMVKRANETASDSDGTRLLRTLLEMIPPRHSKNEELLGIPMAALSDNFLETEINTERCVKPDSPILRVITGPAVLVSVSSRIRVGWWKEEKPVAIPLGVVAMRLRSDKLNPLYLLRCILSTDTHRQLLRMSGNALGLYTGGRSLLPRDLLDVRIPVPPLAEQERVVREEAMRAFGQIQGLVEQGRQQALKVLASHRHQLSNNFLALSCDIDVLRTMMNRNGSLTPDMEINPFTHTTVGQLIEGLEEKCQTVNASISMLKDLTEDMCREINLNQFFNKMLSVTSICGLNRQLYQLIENCDTPDASILFPEKSLTRICENIFTNARKYAFASVPSPDHDRIRITWRVEDDSIVLDIANNGAPLALPSEEVLKAGATTAKDHVGGQGGFEIDNRMRLFDGSVEVLSQPDEEWTVTYRLTFKNIRL
ncbi:MAG: hypothetical protein LIP02_09130 [Bacteroidales bacterium]|nr:hypothetical protein [Bacteroidales bacterium]